MDKKRSLIVLTALRFSDEYGAAALKSARSRGEGVVLCLVVDRDIPEELSGQLAEVGFLGERLMHELRDTMVAEYRERGMAHLEELAKEARRLGLDVETHVAEGPFLETVQRAAAQFGAGRILVARLSRAHLSRHLFGNPIDRLRREAGLPVELFHLSGQRASSAPPVSGD
jgi:nucleotide-binding universal stress UspA family protein